MGAALVGGVECGAGSRQGQWQHGKMRRQLVRAKAATVGRGKGGDGWRQMQQLMEAVLAADLEIGR